MKKETRKLTEKELFQEALGHMSEALCFAYELETDQGKAFCVMLDNTILYGQALMQGHDPRNYCEDCVQREKYENEV